MDVEGPDGKLHTFPQGMPRDAIVAHMRQMYPAPQQGQGQGQGQAGLRGTMADGGAQPMPQAPQQPMAQPAPQQQAAPTSMASAGDPGISRMIQNMPAIHAMFPDMAKGLVEHPAYKQAQAAAQKTQRMQEATSLGIAADDPRFQQYVLTGHLPKFEPDMKAVREADGKVRTQKHLIDDLGRAQQLSETAYDGTLAGARASIVSNLPGIIGGGSKESADTLEFNNIMQNSILPTLKGTFGGRITNADLHLVEQLQAGSNMTKDVRDRILQNAVRRAKEIQAEAADDAHQLRTGSYYRPREQSAPPAKPAKAGWSIERVAD